MGCTGRAPGQVTCFVAQAILVTDATFVPAGSSSGWSSSSASVLAPAKATGFPTSLREQAQHLESGSQLAQEGTLAGAERERQQAAPSQGRMPRERLACTTVHREWCTGRSHTSAAKRRGTQYASSWDGARGQPEPADNNYTGFSRE